LGSVRDVGRGELHVLPGHGLHPQEAFLRTLAVPEGRSSRGERDQQREHGGRTQDANPRVPHGLLLLLDAVIGISTVAHLRLVGGSHTMTAKHRAPSTSEVVIASVKLSRDSSGPSSPPPPWASAVDARASVVNTLSAASTIGRVRTTPGLLARLRPSS